MFVAISVALLVVMFLARLVGDWWWVPGAGAFVVIAAVFVLAQPYLVTGTTPLRDPALRRAVETFERRQGISGVPVSIEDVSGTTSQANAYAIGFGPHARSCCGTRCWTDRSRTAPCASSSHTSSVIIRATTFQRRSAGSVSLRGPARGC